MRIPSVKSVEYMHQYITSVKHAHTIKQLQDITDVTVARLTRLAKTLVEDEEEYDMVYEFIMDYKSQQFIRIVQK